MGSKWFVNEPLSRVSFIRYSTVNERIGLFKQVVEHSASRQAGPNESLTIRRIVDVLWRLACMWLANQVSGHTATLSSLARPRYLIPPLDDEHPLHPMLYSTFPSKNHTKSKLSLEIQAYCRLVSEHHHPRLGGQFCHVTSSLPSPCLEMNCQAMNARSRKKTWWNKIPSRHEVLGPMCLLGRRTTNSSIPGVSCIRRCRLSSRNQTLDFGVACGEQVLSLT
jgi:hypothetical protein